MLESLEIGFFKEKLPGEEIADMHLIDHNRHRNIDKAIFAAIDIVFLPRFNLTGENGVTFEAVNCGFRVFPVKIHTDILPVNGNQDLPVQVNDGDRDACGIRELLKQLPQGGNINDFGDVVIPG